MKFTMITLALTALTGSTLAQFGGALSELALAQELGLTGQSAESPAFKAPVLASSTPVSTPTAAPSFPAFYNSAAASSTPMPTFRRVKRTVLASHAAASSAAVASSAVASSPATPTPSSGAGVMARLEKLLY
ncbi:uncharacterized protein N7511_001071 [Penicillium nucicola]|uniref:uncharacterized protein n=1 Tax=Penicillium nucicola TaxID=1850975 RepID=UPI002545A5C8|nr:uncharacterized protein N7511_001071 [Penicillium nucicola]KAJ5776060.1 hypothetical protein N7511_001071 [Penicillium nucicola]